MKTKEQVQDEIQNEAKAAIEKNNGKGLLAMCTGSGKSRVPILYAKDKKNKVKKIAVIVPTELLRDDGWKSEFKKWKATSLYKNTEMLCYASASKIKGNEYDLVILDEAHNITELSSTFFKNNSIRDIIALTATPPEKEEKQELLSLLGLETVYELSLEEGISLGIVAPVNIHLIYTTLEEKAKTVKMGNKDRYFMQTEKKAYEYYTQCVDYCYETNRYDKLKFQILNRTRFIYNLQSKKEAAEELLDTISDERNIIFCGSVAQAEDLCPFNFHYKSGKRDLNSFINMEIDQLSCVNSLNEGHNLPNIDNAVIVQLNSNALNLIQRIGRVCRWREGHTANIFLFVCKDTQDEKWAENALKSFNQSNIKKYNNIKQLINEFEVK